MLHGPLPLPGGMLLVLGMDLPDGFGQWHCLPASGTTHLVWDAARLPQECLPDSHRRSNVLFPGRRRAPRGAPALM
ncbi:hypothetical protein [Amycolatopsis sp. NPDC051716]|uniref:hypothetical protein n=1 Tax=Amycolatopsis sp. NPDC051716 TaxID=3155804 RepID=UPI003445B450